MLTWLCSCNYNTDFKNIPYNSNKPQNIICAHDYYIFQKEEYYVHNNITHEEYPLFDNPLEGKERINSVYKIKTNQNTVYFLSKSIGYNTTIESINLDTGEHKLLFTDKIYGESITLFDIEISKKTSVKYDNLGYELIDFTICNNSIILFRRESISLLSNKKEKLLYEGYITNFSNDENKVYFTNETQDLLYIDLTAEKTVTQLDIKPHKFSVLNNKIYYISLKNRIFKIYDIPSGTTIYETSAKIVDFDANNEVIVLMNEHMDLFVMFDDFALRKINHNANFDDFLITDTGEILILFKYEIDEFSKYQLYNLNSYRE